MFLETPYCRLTTTVPFRLPTAGVFLPTDRENEEKNKEVRRMREVLKITGALLVAFTMLFISGYGV